MFLPSGQKKGLNGTRIVRFVLSWRRDNEELCRFPCFCDEIFGHTNSVNLQFLYNNLIEHTKDIFQGVYWKL